MLTAALIVQFFVDVESNCAMSVPLGALVPPPPSQFFQFVPLKRLPEAAAVQMQVRPLAAASRPMPNARRHVASPTKPRHLGRIRRGPGQTPSIAFEYTVEGTLGVWSAAPWWLRVLLLRTASAGPSLSLNSR